MQFRHLSTPADYRSCEELQRLTWGRHFREVVPAAILKISQKVGGIAAGAFDPQRRMVGFVFGITGWKDQQLCHWSHMLAVVPTHRDEGVGKKLKEFQQEALLEDGVGIMYWTYDPLVARNAFLNIERLGVTIDEYVPEMYGSDDENSLDHVIGTDRFIVRWNLANPRAPSSAGEAESVNVINANIDDGGVTCLDALRPSDAPLVGIAIPGDIHKLKVRDPNEAARWRVNTRNAFQHYLRNGYDVVGFKSSAGRFAGTYILRRGS